MSQKHVHTHNKEAGFMSLNGMGALLFYLVMLAGAALLVSQLFSTSKLAKTEQAVSSMRIGIKHLYLSQRNYGTEENITKIVADTGIAPEGFKYGTDAEGDFLTSPWGTPIRIKTVANGKRFSITVKTPEEYCLRLATYDLASWYRVDVGGYQITDEDTPDTVSHAYEVYRQHSSKDSLVNVRFYSE